HRIDRRRGRAAEEDGRGSPGGAQKRAAASRSRRDRGARGGRCALRGQAHLAVERQLQGRRGRHAAHRQLRGTGQRARALSRWLAACLVVLIAACAAPALERGSPAQTRLSEAEARAAALARSGDYAGAARFYGEALRLATSLENRSEERRVGKECRARW